MAQSYEAGIPGPPPDLSQTAGEWRADQARVKVAPQVTLELETLEAAVERLDHQIGRLHEPLGGVLRSQAPATPEIRAAIEVPDLVPIADRIRQQRSRIEQMASNVADIVDRLEV